MKIDDIEKKLKDSSSSFVPDILPQIKQIQNTVTPLVLPAKKTSPSVWFARFAYALLFMIIFAGGFYTVYQSKTYDTVYLELNPSIELIVNQFDNIVDVSLLNTDSEEIFENYSFKGKKLNQVIEEFVVRAKQYGYFNELNQDIYLSFVSNTDKNGSKLQKIKQEIQNSLQKNSVTASVVENRFNNGQIDDLTNDNLSPAKFVLIERILSFTDEYSFEQLSEKSMSELKAIYNQLR